MAIGYAPRLPLQKDDIDGYALIKTTRSLIQQNFKMLVLTAPGERMMDPRYGVGLRRYLFEPDTLEVRGELREAIERQVQMYLPYIMLGGLQMQSRENQPEMLDNALQLRIHYSVPSLREVAHLDIDVVSMDT